MKDCLFIPDMNPPICKTKHLTLIASCIPFPGFISFLFLRGIWVYFHGLLYTFSSFCMCIFLQHIILFLNHYRDVHLFFCSLINVLLGTLIYTDSVSPCFLIFTAMYPMYNCAIMHLSVDIEVISNFLLLRSVVQ